MITSFVEYVTEFLKKQSNLDVEKFRSEQTRFYDKDDLIFLEWKLATREEQLAIISACKHSRKKFVLNDIGFGLKCIAEVK